MKRIAEEHLKSLFYFSKEKSKKRAMKISLDPFKQETITHEINSETIHVNLSSVPQFAVEYINKEWLD